MPLEPCSGRKCWHSPVAVAGVCTRVSLRMIFALGPRLALASAAVSSCSTRPTCRSHRKSLTLAFANTGSAAKICLVMFISPPADSR